MKPFSLASLFLLGAAAGGCGAQSEPGGMAGSGGDPLAAQSAYRLACTIDTLVLEIPIELFYALDQPYIADGQADLTFSATVTFTEEVATTLIEAGIAKIDIISVQLTSGVAGATPATVETFLSTAPINDFDLETDTNDDGRPGPHRLRLDATTVATSVDEAADVVELSLGLDQVLLRLGDFEMPVDCLAPSLVGTSVRFKVGSAR